MMNILRKNKYASVTQNITVTFAEFQKKIW